MSPEKVLNYSFDSPNSDDLLNWCLTFKKYVRRQLHYQFELFKSEKTSSDDMNLGWVTVQDLKVGKSASLHCFIQEQLSHQLVWSKIWIWYQWKVEKLLVFNILSIIFEILVIFLKIMDESWITFLLIRTVVRSRRDHDSNDRSTLEGELSEQYA